VRQLGDFGAFARPLRSCGVSTGSKAELLSRLRLAEQQAESLAGLKDQIREAITQVETVISGSASRVDQQVLAELQENLGELEFLVNTMRAAVAKGREFANMLQ
jgi:hypothetical protein